MKAIANGHESAEPAEPAVPAPRGYRLPAEWEPHAATWLAWPHQRADWPDRFGPIPWVYVDFVRQLSRYEPVSILVPDKKTQRRAADSLDRAGVDAARVAFHKIATDRSWTRDFVPAFVVDDHAETETDRVAVIDWNFNGWAKYENHQRDAKVARRMARALGLKRWVATGPNGRPVVLEGGAIDANGKGSLLVTEECLLSPVQERNPNLGRERLEAILGAYLGVRHVIWLGQGIAGDDTHGHVDDLARFVADRTVVVAEERDRKDVNFQPLRDNLRQLRAAVDQDHKPLQVVTLPMPAPVIFEGQRLPASYANFYIANGAVFVPTFNDPNDRAAMLTLEVLFPGRDVIGIHALDLVWGLGTLHCMTHEQPAFRLESGPTTRT